MARNQVLPSALPVLVTAALVGHRRRRRLGRTVSRHARL